MPHGGQFGNSPVGACRAPATGGVYVRRGRGRDLRGLFPGTAHDAKLAYHYRPKALLRQASATLTGPRRAPGIEEIEP